MSGISPGFDLMLYLDRSLLGQIQSDLQDICSLQAINAKDFCFVVLKWLCLRFNYWNIDDSIIRLICRVFDCVDIDSRGVICWEDFNSYCLRVGRNQFKPSFRQGAQEYVQRFAYSLHVPARKLLYVPFTQMLYAYDGDMSSVTIIGYENAILPFFLKNRI